MSTTATTSRSAATETKLYVIPTHPCRTSMLMLEHKGIPYLPVVLHAPLHPLALRLHGFRGNPAPFRDIDGRPHRVLALADRMGTVPALLHHGKRVMTNRDIARFLDQVQPDPPLFPAEPEKRLAVEEAEGWGDEIFQMAVRRLLLAAMLHGRDGIVNRGEDGRLGAVISSHETTRFAAARLVARLAFATDARTEHDLMATLPGMLDRIDAWIEAQVLNDDHLNAADFAIVTSLALLCYRPDVRAQLQRRPALALLDRVLPEP